MGAVLGRRLTQLTRSASGRPLCRPPLLRGRAIWTIINVADTESTPIALLSERRLTSPRDATSSRTSGETGCVLPALMPGNRYTSDLVDQLERLALDASNARTGGTAGALLDKYLEFADRAAHQLAWQLKPSSISQLILTDSYWRAHGVGNIQHGNRVAERELQATQDRLADAASAVKNLLSAWPSCDVVLVPDTNVLMQGTQGAFRDADWHDLAGLATNESLVIVLLQAVLDELDSHKLSSNKTARRLARRALREIDAMFTTLQRSVVQVSAERFVYGGHVEGANVHLMVAADPVEHSRLPDSDGEIIDRAIATAAQSSARLLFITGDTGAALRAKAAGLDVRKIPTPDPEGD